jgi:hypothetical protein
VQVVQATKMQLNTILYHSTGVVIGCGDASIKMYTHAGEFQGQLKLDGPVINLSSSPDRLEVSCYVCTDRRYVLGHLSFYVLLCPVACNLKRATLNALLSSSTRCWRRHPLARYPAST